MPRLLQTAIQNAVGRSGVSVVSLPGDIADQPAPEMVTGFALSASKIVLDGGVGRMLQMARSNLRNVPRS
jgi:pyruvate dehydrogenase (quinone)